MIKTSIQTTQFDINYKTRIFNQKIIDKNKCKNMS